MSGPLEFDTEVAAATADSWSTWGDHLNHAKHALALDLEQLQLGGVTSPACGHLGSAATHLWTASAFTDRVRLGVSEADWYRAYQPRYLATLMEQVARSVAGAAGGRAAEGRRWALLDHLRTASPAEVRRHFEGIGLATPEEVLSGLFGEEAALYWDALGPREQATLAATRPDLVVLHAIAGGAEVNSELLDAIDASNAFGTFSTSLGVDLDVSIGLKVIQLDLGGDVTVTVTKMSDGTVEMLLVEGVHVGGGQDLSMPGAASAGWAAGGAVEFQQKFAFDDESQATEAIATLQAALARDVSFSEISADVLKGSLNQLVGVANAPSGVWNLTNHLPIVNRLPDAPLLPTFDLTPETAKALQQLWDDHGLEHVEAIGVYASADAQFDAAMAELSAAATASVMFYDQDARGGSDGEGRTGVVVAGSVELDGSTDLGIDPTRAVGQHGSLAANFAVDIHHVDGAGMEMTLLLSGDIGGGATVELFELQSAELDLHQDRTVAGTIEMVVPIDDPSDVLPLITLLGSGALPADDIRRLYDQSEISVTLRTGTTTTTAFELDAGVVTVGATAQYAETETVVALHKFPGGDMHNQIELDQIIERAG